jgi:glycerol uptake facilitator-like aquaporin
MDPIKYVTELVGTFIFVLAVLMLVDWVGIQQPIALSVSIGAVLAFLIWTAIQIGGEGLLNPALTVAKLYEDYSGDYLIPYLIFICCQFLGATAAYYVHVNIRK